MKVPYDFWAARLPAEQQASIPRFWATFDQIAPDLPGWSFSDFRHPLTEENAVHSALHGRAQEPIIVTGAKAAPAAQRAIDLQGRGTGSEGQGHVYIDFTTLEIETARARIAEILGREGPMGQADLLLHAPGLEELSCPLLETREIH